MSPSTDQNGGHPPSNQEDLPNSTIHSPLPSRSNSKTRDGRREKQKVRFTPGGESVDVENRRASFDIRDEDQKNESRLSRAPTRLSPAHSRNHSFSNRPVRHYAAHVPHPADIHQRLSEAVMQGSQPQILKPKPSFLRNNSVESPPNDLSIIESSDNEDDVLKIAYRKDKASQYAQNRAMRLSRKVGTQSAPTSAKVSPTLSATSDAVLASHHSRGPSNHLSQLTDIPLDKLDKDGHRQHETYSTDSDSEHPSKQSSHTKKGSRAEAERLVKVRAQNGRGESSMDGGNGARSGAVTPESERDEDWVAPPTKYRPGILSHLIKHQQASAAPDAIGLTIGGRRNRSASSLTDLALNSLSKFGAASRSGTADTTPGTESSGTTTPRKWYENQRPSSTSSLAALVGSSALAMGGVGGGSKISSPTSSRPNLLRTKRNSGIGNAIKGLGRPNHPNSRHDDEVKLTVHIADVVARHKYIIKLCRALMLYGAPTHRLEEYLKMTARVLEVEGQFLYLPGCMIISFDDSETHTAEVKLVRLIQAGVNLGKLKEVHKIYKEVVHDIVRVDDATQRLEAVMDRPDMNPWIKVFFFGLASATVGPFAFGARFIDMPMSFVLGSFVGVMQFILAARSSFYANVFEVTAAVITSFLARGLGSIRGGNLFCFSAIAQSSIAMILPGYTVLSASLELQSKAIVPGSVRMVSAIIYSLFLGFGITIGTVVFALIYKPATSATTCQGSLGSSEYLQWIFVPLFTLCLMVINNAHREQAPAMSVIAFAGYLVNFWSAKRLPSSAQISQTLGAFVVGVLGNLYSRLGHGVAAAALLPAIFVQVPSGLAATGSLVSGIQSADTILATNKTATGADGGVAGATYTQGGNIVYNVGVGMVQVAIGITVGLFLSALVVYPFGKKRSGLFSF